MNLYKSTVYESGENVWRKQPYSGTANGVVAEPGSSIAQKVIAINSSTLVSETLSSLLGLAEGQEVKYVHITMNSPVGFDIVFSSQSIIGDCTDFSFKGLHNLDFLVIFDASSKDYDFAANPTEISILYVF